MKRLNALSSTALLLTLTFTLAACGSETVVTEDTTSEETTTTVTEETEETTSTFSPKTNTETTMRELNIVETYVTEMIYSDTDYDGIISGSGGSQEEYEDPEYVYFVAVEFDNGSGGGGSCDSGDYTDFNVYYAGE